MSEFSLEKAIANLKQTFTKQPWWSLVQDEVKQALEKVIDHVIVVGPAFRDAYVATYYYEHRRRSALKELVARQNPVFTEMTEEAYQCGHLPAKMLLLLDDWVKPNDADVRACIELCSHIDILETFGITEKKTQEVPVSKEAKVFTDKTFPLIAHKVLQKAEEPEPFDPQEVIWEFGKQDLESS